MGKARASLAGVLVAGLLVASGCGGSNARTTDGGGSDVGPGSGGSGAQDAAVDRHEATDRTSASDRAAATDAHQTGDGGCGALGQSCCAPKLTCQGDPATIVCAYLLIPNDYTCIHCGGLNEPCCPSGAGCSDPTLACDTTGQQPSLCKTCGLTGNPCCAGASPCSGSGACCDQFEHLCLAPGSTCYLEDSISSGICAAGVCECGHENERCCDYNGGYSCLETQDRCTPAEIHNCKACGLPNNPCCANNSCANGGCCVYDPTFGGTCVANGGTCSISPNAVTCTAGACGSCGGLGQPCCFNLSNICTAPNTFCPTQQTSATCQACGGKGQPCCGYDSVDTTGTDCQSGLTCSSTSATTGGTCQ